MKPFVVDESAIIAPSVGRRSANFVMVTFYDVVYVYVMMDVASQAARQICVRPAVDTANSKQQELRMI